MPLPNVQHIDLQLKTRNLNQIGVEETRHLQRGSENNENGFMTTMAVIPEMPGTMTMQQCIPRRTQFYHWK